MNYEVYGTFLHPTAPTVRMVLRWSSDTGYEIVDQTTNGIGGWDDYGEFLMRWGPQYPHQEACRTAYLHFLDRARELAKNLLEGA
ncbi:MAG: hypothetical protein ACYTFZ_09585 [Planctomycetota bacterium]|jgi:hypothetical protein